MPAATAGLLALVLSGVVLDQSPANPPVRISAAAQLPADDPASAAEPPPSSPPPPASGPVSPPVRLSVPRIGVDAPVAAGGLNADGTVETPPMNQPGQVDWYGNGPAPGQVGPAVLLGHINTTKGPAVFARLLDLRQGDRIDIRRQDGSTVSYRVRGLGQYAKTAFPTALVYGNTSTPQLRLITCGGTLASNGHYTDNIVVYADLITG
ncbi:sortase (surface protein transpeptidase) [Kitasatospora sp. MAA4]|uniref:class F sortase n=1 Tax=Kitasatospora sp. MAA4 TaxID=3035093 RepID=UPI0024761378|nr:class F sortase [Kitasatospora sp. MAA4]MDH6135904.1 sortase (surface protein transpeptidase) [Kitasatospora sp. MAA4]